MQQSGCTQLVDEESSRLAGPVIKSSAPVKSSSRCIRLPNLLIKLLYQERILLQHGKKSYSQNGPSIVHPQMLIQCTHPIQSLPSFEPISQHQHLLRPILLSERVRGERTSDVGGGWWRGRRVGSSVGSRRARDGLPEREGFGVDSSGFRSTYFYERKRGE
jgi:hypothetical protein